MKYKKSSWEKVDAENVDPKVKQQIFTTDNIMVVRYVYDPGLHFPEHSHPQEQTTIVEKGRLIYSIDGEDVELNAGEILTIKPNVKHGTVTPPDITSVAISIFTPVSEKIVIEK
ncbi:MAG: cupin domain-containing protein [Calditrichia bacterium]|nr:cupin domain-containing protein [Calditrichia bacterium]